MGRRACQGGSAGGPCGRPVLADLRHHGEGGRRPLARAVEEMCQRAILEHNLRPLALVQRCWHAGEVDIEGVGRGCAKFPVADAVRVGTPAVRSRKFVIETMHQHVHRTAVVAIQNGVLGKAASMDRRGGKDGFKINAECSTMQIASCNAVLALRLGGRGCILVLCDQMVL